MTKTAIAAPAPPPGPAAGSAATYWYPIRKGPPWYVNLQRRRGNRMMRYNPPAQIRALPTAPPAAFAPLKDRVQEPDRPGHVFKWKQPPVFG